MILEVADWSDTAADRDYDNTKITVFFWQAGALLALLIDVPYFMNIHAPQMTGNDSNALWT